VSWNLVWSRLAKQDLRRLDHDVARRILQALDQLAESGHGDIRPRRSRERQWRPRVGEWHVIFSYDTDDPSIRIIRVLPRGRAYR
jgi:mRNA-degrading endonuclease RelE of RelBE toxin-antitoxin system